MANASCPAGVRIVVLARDKTKELNRLLAGYLEDVGAVIPEAKRHGEGEKKDRREQTNDQTSKSPSEDERRFAKSEDRSRPNVLFIAIDELNDWVGPLGGHPQVKTPRMDRLARRGVVFANAHCAAPVCNPSRTAVLNGKQLFETGVYSNGGSNSDIRKVLFDAAVPLHSGPEVKMRKPN